MASAYLERANEEVPGSLVSRTHFGTVGARQKRGVARVDVRVAESVAGAEYTKPLYERLRRPCARFSSRIDEAFHVAE